MIFSSPSSNRLTQTSVVSDIAKVQMRKEQREKFGRYLREARIKAGLSQGDVSKKLRLKSAQSVSNFERGVSPVPTYVLREVMKMYKIKENDFVGYITRLQVESLRQDLFGRST